MFLHYRNGAELDSCRVQYIMGITLSWGSQAQEKEIVSLSLDCVST